MRFDDRKPLASSEFENQFGNVFSRRIGIDQIQRLAEFLQYANRRIVAAKIMR